MTYQSRLGHSIRGCLLEPSQEASIKLVQAATVKRQRFETYVGWVFTYVIAMIFCAASTRTDS